MVKARCGQPRLEASQKGKSQHTEGRACRLGARLALTLRKHLARLLCLLGRPGGWDALKSNNHVKFVHYFLRHRHTDGGRIFCLAKQTYKLAHELGTKTPASKWQGGHL